MDKELLKTFFTVSHIIGAVVGAGGALYSDLIFIKSLKDKKIDRTEFHFLKTFSRFVWLGLSVLMVSGIGLFLLDPKTYLSSDKFITKMIIVAVITINGIFFHIIHIPFIKKKTRLHTKLLANDPNHEDAKLLISGVVSMTSWSIALILGSLRSIPISYNVALGIYTCLIGIGCISTIGVIKIIHKKTKKDLIFATIALNCLGLLLILV